MISARAIRTTEHSHTESSPGVIARKGSLEKECLSGFAKAAYRDGVFGWNGRSATKKRFLILILNDSAVAFLQQVTGWILRLTAFRRAHFFRTHKLRIQPTKRPSNAPTKTKRPTMS